MKRILGVLGAVAFFLLFANAAGAQSPGPDICLDAAYESYPGCTAAAGAADGWAIGYANGESDSLANLPYNNSLARSAYSDAYLTSYKAGYKAGYASGCAQGGACEESGSGTGDGNLTVNVNLTHGKDCSDYWSKADCNAGCQGNGFVAGSDCKQLGNGVVTPGNVGGSDPDHKGTGGPGHNMGNKGGLAVTGSDAADVALAGAALLVGGGAAVMFGKRRFENHAD